MTSGALAIFVKTPGLSPVKTRLAKVLGAKRAEMFYRLSCAAVAAVAEKVSVFLADEAEDGPGALGLVPYWAVAETRGLSHPDWQGFARLDQGDGGLGARLACVYATLLASHSFVLLVGADLPQLSWRFLAKVARTYTRDGGFCLGPARDGGFYLFGGAVPIAPELWQGVPYSTSETAVRLVDAVSPLGNVRRFGLMTDADEVTDFDAVRAELRAMPDILPEQERVLAWLDAL